MTPHPNPTSQRRTVGHGRRYTSVAASASNSDGTHPRRFQHVLSARRNTTQSHPKSRWQRATHWSADATITPAAVASTSATAPLLPPPAEVAVLPACSAYTGLGCGSAGGSLNTKSRTLPPSTTKSDNVSERPATDAQLLEQQRAQFVQWSSLAEVMAYYELLKKQLKVQIKVARP